MNRSQSYQTFFFINKHFFAIRVNCFIVIALLSFVTKWKSLSTKIRKQISTSYLPVSARVHERTLLLAISSLDEQTSLCKQSLLVAKCVFNLKIGRFEVTNIFFFFLRESSINDVTQFWTFFDTLPPLSRFLLLRP